MASRSSNRAEVPEAKEALDRFKMEVAGELGVPLSDGYNGNLTSAQNGSVGGSQQSHFGHSQFTVNQNIVADNVHYISCQ